LEVGGNM